MSAYMPDKYVQIDVVKVEGVTTTCNLYTGARCIRMIMHTNDYNDLMRTGFFNRDGKSKDSAGVLNTTDVFIPQ